MTKSNTLEYPWLASAYQSLSGRYLQNNLPHAMLIHGLEGLGKLNFISTFLRALLCETNTELNSIPSASQSINACGHCHSCQLYEVGTHPDVMHVAPEKEAGAITIDQIRHLNELVTLKSQLGGMQVILIDKAHRLNRNASNGLLKTLEEPTPNVFIVLLTNKMDRLLPTIRSRCQVQKIAVPEHDVARQWLQTHMAGTTSDIGQIELALRLAQGAPLAALSFLEDGTLEQYQKQLEQFVAIAFQRQFAVEVAASWLNTNISLSLRWMLLWVSTTIRVKLLTQSAAIDLGPDWQKLQNLAKSVDLVLLYHFYDQLLECIKLLDSQVNQQLMLEQLLIRWQQACVKR